ncbi:SOAT1 family protein [Megaselia abdita]
METAITLNMVQKKLQTFQTKVMEDVQKKMDVMFEELVQEVRQYEMQSNEFKNFRQHHELWSNRLTNQMEVVDSTTKTVTSEVKERKTETEEHDKSKKKLPDKVFVPRESYLTCLLEVDHMKAIYHVFVAVLLLLLLNVSANDYFEEGRVNFGLNTIKGGFRGIHYVLGVLVVKNILAFGLFYAFRIWAAVRFSLLQNKVLCSFWNKSCLILFISFQLVFGYVGSMLCIKFNLPFVSSSVLLLETVRLMMKMHAFVRTNAGRQLQGKLKGDSKVQVMLPKFSSYLYFLFAPTLIYRDEYPRTKQIRWKFALSRLSEVIAIMFVYSYVHERYIEPLFKKYGDEEITKASLSVKIFGMLMPSTIIFLCGFYLILHSWMNFAAEVLRFADRMFYKDWWTASNYEAYYRNWNIVVHDWLYEYIYKDMYNHIFKGSKLMSSLTVFFVSAYVHEHILGFGLKLFYPIMYVFFGGFGVFFIAMTKNLPKQFGNFVVWFTLISGNSLMIALYVMEYYARQNCPVGDSFLDYIKPVSWSCNGLTEN